MEVDRFTVTSEYEPPFERLHVQLHELEVMGLTFGKDQASFGSFFALDFVVYFVF
jgi:hypothetical protein